MKYHLKRATTNIKLTFEECATVISQVEACLNSRPLVAIHSDDDGLEALTPGHFLIGRPIEALPDPSFSYRAIPSCVAGICVKQLSDSFGNDGLKNTLPA